MKRVTGLTLLMSISGLIACSRHKPHQDEWDKANMRDIAISDSRFQQAVAQTQDSLAIFLSRFKAYSRDTSYQFYIKSDFEEREYIESMWSRPIEVVGQSLRSVLDNQPRNLQQIHLGDTVLIEFKQIVDIDITHQDSLLMGNYINKQMNNAH
jgi:uncharacterized protein YegJ (DUF2314 family)